MTLSLLLLSFSVVSSGVAATEQQLLEWVRSKGGYFNPKQELRHEVRNDASTLYGVFASQDIEDREVLASIPWDCILHVEGSEDRFDNCDTVRLLAEEMSNPTQYALYVESQANTAKRHAKLLPTNWSEEGKALLLKVTNNGVLPPEDPFLLDFEWKHKCDVVHKDATLLVMTHGEDFGMVPLTDRYNHRGGNWTGAYFSIDGGDDEVGVEITAVRSIQKGEQIFTDYKDNKDGERIGTPELLRDYGFVEDLSQRYFFDDQNIAFDIDDNLQVWWHDDWVAHEAIDFLEEQLQRLQEHVCPEVEKLASDAGSSIPRHESATTSQYCRDLMTAMVHAITIKDDASYQHDVDEESDSDSGDEDEDYADDDEDEDYGEMEGEEL